MASLYDYKITLRDSRGLLSTLYFDLGEFTGADAGVEHINAQSAANQLRGALVDITTAFVASERLILRHFDNNQVPAVGVADVTDEAFVLTHLNPPTDVRKVHGIRIPAPIVGLFQADLKTVDVTAALLIQYVQQVAQHAFVSDGEQINTSTGNNGMDSGYWRSRPKSTN